VSLAANSEQKRPAFSMDSMALLLAKLSNLDWVWLIKLRGSSCWQAKTCLWYHFETQPIPSPLSFLFHFLPKWMLSRAVDLNLIVQVYPSWMVLVPAILAKRSRICAAVLRLGGAIQVGFRMNIIISGNFAFLNF